MLKKLIYHTQSIKNNVSYPCSDRKIFRSCIINQNKNFNYKSFSCNLDNVNKCRNCNETLVNKEKNYVITTEMKEVYELS